MKTKLKLLMAFKIWMVIYPSILLFHYLIDDLLSALPSYQKSLVLTMILVPWVVFIGIPCVDFVLKSLSKVSFTSKK